MCLLFASHHLIINALGLHFLLSFSLFSESVPASGSWAASTVMTRQNRVPVNLRGDQTTSSSSLAPADGDAADQGAESGPVLIPLWDMANHMNGQIATGYNEELQRVESQTLKAFAKGEQIFIYYGDRTNADFMVHNG